MQRYCIFVKIFPKTFLHQPTPCFLKFRCSFRSSVALHCLIGGLRYTDIKGFTARVNTAIIPSVQSLQLELAKYTNRPLYAWGTGELFLKNRRRVAVELTAVVDNDCSKWGKQIDGLRVVAPGAILQHPNAVILVFSCFFKDIEQQVRELGDFPIIDMRQHIDFEKIARFRQTLQPFLDKKVVRHPRSDTGIVVQGPICEGWTRLFLQYLAVCYPDNPIILSTWDTESIDGLEPLVDKVVLSKEPEFAGITNRNRQIVGVRNGLQAAQAMGVRKILKVRTDLIPLNRNILAACEAEQTRHATSTKHLRHRLLIPEAFTMKYFHYHPSDFMMFGDVDDLLAFWDIPLDTDRESYKTPAYDTRPMLEMSRLCPQTECYLSKKFCEKVGWQQTFTIEDSWNFYKTFFVVLPNLWFDLAWVKWPNLPPPQTTTFWKDCVSAYFWQQLDKGICDSDLARQFENHPISWKLYYTTDASD